MTSATRQAVARRTRCLPVLVIVTAGLACSQQANEPLVVKEGAPMPEKLDPRLLELVQSVDGGRGDSEATVEVLVALDAPIDAGVREELTARGLSLRSEIGTILTGTIRLKDVSRLASSPRVVKLEASAPLYRERSGGEG